MADLEGMEPGVPGFCIINVERREGYKRWDYIEKKIQLPFIK